LLTEYIVVLRVKVDQKSDLRRVAELIAARAWDIQGAEGAELMSVSNRIDIEPHHVNTHKVPVSSSSVSGS
jgi:hypothetical protein